MTMRRGVKVASHVPPPQPSLRGGGSEHEGLAFAPSPLWGEGLVLSHWLTPSPSGGGSKKTELIYEH